MLLQPWGVLGSFRIPLLMQDSRGGRQPTLVEFDRPQGVVWLLSAHKIFPGPIISNEQQAGGAGGKSGRPQVVSSEMVDERSDYFVCL